MRNSGVLFGLVSLLGLVANCSPSSDPEQDQPNGSAGSGAAVMCQTGYSACGSVCVNTTADFSNCGSCGKVCGASQSCSNSSCICVTGLASCGSSCVSLASDPANCGQCGTVCPANQVCSQNKCSDTCASGELKCGNSCVDATSDAKNCGTCGTSCGANQYCANSACECMSGTRCMGECVDTQNATQHCGDCGKSCSPGQMCMAGNCVGTPTGGGGAGGTPGVGGGPAGGTPGGGGMPANGGSGGGSGGGGPMTPEGRDCPVSDGLIADFEEGKADVLAIEGRLGRFEGYGDAAGTQTAAVENEGATECNQGVFHAKGSGFAEYVGVAAVLKGTLDTAKNEYAPAKYDASAWTGISFRAKKGANHVNPVRFGVATPWTEGAPYGDGTCSDTDTSNSCWNHLGHFLIDEEELTNEWKTYTFCFDRDFYPLFLPNGVSTENRANISANLLKLQFQFNQSFDPATAMQVARAAAFDFYVDDVKFVKTPCQETIFQSSAGTAVPFGKNANVGTCAPAKDAAKYNKAITEAYNRWKAKFVNAQGAVISPEQNNKTISEGIGYGMLITAAIGDKDMFEKIWGWAKPKLQNGLLPWDNGQAGTGSATDADTDIAYALLMAAKQWGGTYKADGDAMAAAARTRTVDGSNLLKPGDQYDNNLFNPSYFSPGFYRAFGATWDPITPANYTALDRCDQQFSGASDGLVPDWCNRTNGAPQPPSAQVTSGNLCPANQACYTYDAARTPWRIGFDVCTGGTAGKAYVDRLLQKFASQYQMGARIDLMKAGWDSAGQALPMAVDNEMAFIGPVGVAAMASSSHTVMRDRAFRTVLDIIERPEYYKTYYSTTLGVLTLLMLSGNWPAL